MSPLGVIVNTREAPPSRGAPVDTGTWLVVGQTGSGQTGPAKLVRDINSYAASFGQRSSGGSLLYDAADNYFREGGKRLVVGPYGSSDTPDDGLAKFNKGHGPGQVSCPGEDDATTYALLTQHAADNNRWALLDATDEADATAMEDLGDGIPSAYKTYGSIHGPLVTVPGPVGVVGVTSRNVAASSSIAALCARIDATGNPNQAAAGFDWPLQYAVDFKHEYSDEDTETLLDAGVNLLRPVFGVMQGYGFQTVVGNDIDPVFWQANCGRMRMALKAQSYAIGQTYLFATLDGRGFVEGRFQTALEGMLKRYWQANALYGLTEPEAFQVEVGTSVNTDETIAQGEMHAVAMVRLSLHARAIFIDLVSVPVNQAIAA